MALMDDVFCLVQFCLGHSLKRKKIFSNYIEAYELKTITLFIEALTLVFSFSSVLSHSLVQLFEIPWTVACQALPSMKFFRQEYWSGLQFPTPRDLPNSGIKPMSLASPALADGLFTTAPSRKPLFY